MPRATLLLPAAARFGGQRLGDAFARALGRADRGEARQAGRRAQLLRHFELLPGHWSIAALTRQSDVGDAAGATWLRADPAHVRPDINGARLLACGEGLALDDKDVAALLPALKPLFGDAGFALDAPTPARWYLRLPIATTLPAFTEPVDALGADLFDHLAEGGEGRRWRALASEAQVVLHNHPWNAQRAAAGKPAINSLWFWGGGVLPDRVRTSHDAVHGNEETARALAVAAQVAAPLPARFAMGGEDSALFDLHATRDLALLESDWLQPALMALADSELNALALDLDDGTHYTLRRGQRWRLWRKPQARFDA
jgi:hypothetical protein